LGRKAVGTADFCLFMDMVFDSVNASSVRAMKGKNLRSVVTSNSKHISIWNEAMTVFNSMTFVDNRGKISKPPCIKNWITTLKGFKSLWFTLNKEGFKYLITRNINQDSLECLFGQFRQLSGRNIYPDCYHFVNSFKTLFLNNFSSIKSKETNCQQNEIDTLSNLKSFLTCHNIKNIKEVPIKINFLNINSITNINKTNHVNDTTVSYVAGFLMKKNLSWILQCNTCKFEYNCENITNPLIKIRQYDNVKHGLCIHLQNYFILLKKCL